MRLPCNVPTAGQAVTVPAGQTIVLDVSPPPLGAVIIDGTLRFEDRQDLNLSAKRVMVSAGGRLQVGTESQPFTHRATIILLGTPSDDKGQAMGSKVLGVRGTLDLHGRPQKSWTRLNAHARAGATTLRLEKSVNWRAGDRIALASTDFDYRQDEDFTLTAVRGAGLTLGAPVERLHWGETQSYGGRTVDERAEVALLSRNVVVRGGEDGLDRGFGGHLMAMKGSTVRISHTEFDRMGQRGRQGRYPVHFHLAGDASGSYLRGSSIHDSFNRCVTIHGAHNLEIKDNVAYQAVGHCFFLEDGIETGNVLERNLGFGIKRPERKDALLPTDVSYIGAAVFWITNPDNVLRGNVAAGSEGAGFWIALPEHPTGASATTDVWPRRTPLRVFAGNVAHSSGSDGLHVDGGPNTRTLKSEVSSWYARKNPRDEKSAYVTVRFENFTAYKNRIRGVWLRGYYHVLEGAILADNAIGATFASRESWAENSLFVGETANVGTPGKGKTTGVGGRSLPRPWVPDGPIRGFEFYDGRVGIRNSHLAEFKPNAVRQASALGTLRFTDFPTHPKSFAENLSFGPNTKRLFMETRALPGDRTEGGEDGFRSLVFLDKDGSLTGRAGRSVVVDNPFLLTDACSAKADWNVYVCNETYAALGFWNREGSSKDVGQITVKRLDGGAAHVMRGEPGRPARRFQTSVPIGRSYAAKLEKGAPKHLQTWLRYATPGQSIFLRLDDYPWSDVHIYRDWWIDKRNRMQAASSVEEVKNSSGDRYFLRGKTLYVKLQVRPGKDHAALEICPAIFCNDGPLPPPSKEAPGDEPDDEPSDDPPSDDPPSDEPPANGSGVVAGQPYFLRNADHGLYLGTSSGNRLQTQKLDGDSQDNVFQLIAVRGAEGIFYIDNGKSGRGLLETRPNRYVRWAREGRKDGPADRQWAIEKAENGTVRLRSLEDGRGYLTASARGRVWWNEGGKAKGTRWKLESVTSANVAAEAAELTPVALLPTEYALDGAYPNPFNPTTTIRYALPEQADVRLEVFDAMGRRVAVLADGSQGAGYHEATFEAASLASGVYLYHFDAQGATGRLTKTGKAVLMK